MNVLVVFFTLPLYLDLSDHLYCAQGYWTSCRKVALLHHALVFNFSGYYCIRQRAGKMSSI